MNSWNFLKFTSVFFTRLTFLCLLLSFLLPNFLFVCVWSVNTYTKNKNVCTQYLFSIYILFSVSYHQPMFTSIYIANEKITTTNNMTYILHNNFIIFRNWFLYYVYISVGTNIHPMILFLQMSSTTYISLI